MFKKVTFMHEEFQPTDTVESLTYKINEQLRTSGVGDPIIAKPVDWEPPFLNVQFTKEGYSKLEIYFPDGPPNIFSEFLVSLPKLDTSGIPNSKPLGQP